MGYSDTANTPENDWAPTTWKEISVISAGPSRTWDEQPPKRTRTAAAIALRNITSALSGPGTARTTRRRRDNRLRACGALAKSSHGPLQRIVRWHRHQVAFEQDRRVAPSTLQMKYCQPWYQRYPELASKVECHG